MTLSDHAREQILRFDPELPIERAWMPPSSWYTDGELYRVECREALLRNWQLAARVDQLARPGDYVSGCFAGHPWVVVRTDDGAIRGFHNVCRHKGREVVTGSGRAADGVLVCGYHAWAYDFEGKLRSAPRIGGIEEFDRETMGLPSLAIESWGPWVFFNADLDAPSLRATLGPLTEKLDAGGWEKLRFYKSVEWTIECNWKVVADNYLDGGYHIPFMHPTLDAQIEMQSYRTELFERFNIQTTDPASAADERIDFDAAERIGSGAIYAWIYPNLMLNRYGPCLDSNYVIPLGPERCKVIYDFYFDPDRGDESIRESVEQSAVTQREDIEICESVQLGLGSSSYETGRYAPRVEHGEHHFHRLLAADLRRAL